MKVAVIMPVHNALDYVRDSTQAVIRELSAGTPFVIVDDASKPDTSNYLLELLEDTPYNMPMVLRNNKQQLFTRSCNRGMRAAYYTTAPEVMVFVNSDCKLSPGWLDGIIQGFTDPKAGIVGYPDTPDGVAPYYREVTVPGYITGHCFGVRTALLEQIGVLCETDLVGRDSPELAPYKGQAHIGSERILSWRANMAGWKTVYCHKKLVVHEAGKSWNHDLGWLASFDLHPLWEPSDDLAMPRWYNWEDSTQMEKSLYESRTDI